MNSYFSVIVMCFCVMTFISRTNCEENDSYLLALKKSKDIDTLAGEKSYNIKNSI